MAESSERSYEFGKFHLDVLRHRLFCGDETVPLAPKAFELLLLLVRSQSQLVKKDDLMRMLWPDTIVEESNLTQNVFQVRKALGETAHDHQYIVTVPGQGYRFVADVRQSDALVRQEPAATDRPGALVAVVPFRVLGGTPDDEHLGLALADALITRLSGLRGITMRPTGSVMRYAAGAPDPLAAGRELGADTLVHGVIHRAGASLRFTVQIVNVPASAVVWAGTIDQASLNVFAAQDAVCEQIGRALMTRMTDEERGRILRRYTGNLEAYQSYLRGRHLLPARTSEAYRKAIGCFEQAILQDPRYALAHTGLADCHNLLAYYSLEPPGEAWPRGLAAAERAVSTDDRLAEAHSSLALARMGFEWNWRAAEEECLRALQLDPAYTAAHIHLAEWHLAHGKTGEAIREIRRAQKLEPLSLIVNRDVGAVLYYARQYDEAIEHLRDSLELSVDFALTHYTLAWALERKGMYGWAIEHLEKAIKLAGPTSQFLGELGHAYAASGDHVRCAQVLQEMQTMARTAYVSPYDLALVNLGMGDRQQALSCLEKACETRVWQVTYFLVEPKLDPIRSSPRFQVLLRRVGLAPGNSERPPFSGQ